MGTDLKSVLRKGGTKVEKIQGAGLALSEKADSSPSAQNDTAKGCKPALAKKIYDHL